MKGFMPIHRKLMESWQWEDPVFRSAWIWLLMNAEWRETAPSGLERGQVRFSLRQAKKKWGMSKDKAHRFLKKLETDGSIHWRRGGGVKKTQTQKKCDSKCDKDETASATALGVITLLKYNEYNPTDGGECDSKCDKDETASATYIKNKNKNKEHKKEEGAVVTFSKNRNTAEKPPKPKRTQRKTPILRRGPELLKALDDLKDRLPELYELYEPSIVDETYERFRLKTIESENQYNYRHFFVALTNWLKKDNQPINSKNRPPTDPKKLALWNRLKKEGKL